MNSVARGRAKAISSAIAATPSTTAHREISCTSSDRPARSSSLYSTPESVSATPPMPVLMQLAALEIEVITA